MLKIKPLRDELVAAGLFERCEVRSWLKFGTLMSVVTAIFVLMCYGPMWLSVLLVPVAGALCAIAAMLGHEGSHRGLSRSPFRNRLLYTLCFPVLGGVSGLYWHWKHDVQHHAHPNVADLDPDIQLWPMAASAVEHRRSNRARQWFQRNHQGWMFWPLCGMLLWSMRGSTLAYLYEHAKTKGMTRAWRMDVLMVSLHYVAWVALPTLIFGPIAMGVYCGVWTVGGLVLSLVFAPAHIGMPVVSSADDIWRLQFETTRNLRLPGWLSYFFIGLDYQIEHHLFPKMPHQNLPRAASITRAWAEKNGLPYHEIGYWDALVDVTRHMDQCWSLEPEEMVTINPKGPKLAEKAA